MDDTNATVESSLLHIPPEILLVILSLLDVPDIISARKTCRALCKITYERTIWVSLLQDQAKYLPLPPDILQLYCEDEHVQTCSTSLIEGLVVRDRRIAEAWPRLRSVAPQKPKKEPPIGVLIVLQLFIERWLVALYSDGEVRIYDTHTPDVALCVCSQLEGLRTFPSHALSVDSNGEKLTLIMSYSNPPYLIDIYQLNFSDLSKPLASRGFDLVQVLVLPIFKAVKAIETSERLLILSSASDAKIEIVKWDESYNEQVLTHNRPVFRLNNEDMEALWNGVIAVRFFGSHILVFKARSLEIFRYKNHASSPQEPPGFVLKHSFHMTFRDGSFSDYSVTLDPLTANTIYEMNAFACDVIQGLFHYTIRLSVPPATAQNVLPFLNVSLTSVYPLAHGVIEPLPTSVSVPSTHSNRPAIPMTYSANFSPSPSFSHTHRGGLHSSSSHTQDNGNGRNPHDYSFRGFVSAQCLGPQGKRGIWVERRRTSTVREVQVWSRDPPTSSRSVGSIPVSNSRRLLAGEHARDITREGASPYVSEMERRVIYTLHSYDLRDDITLCTFGEISGTIALGHRSGEISIIKLEL